MNSTSTEQQIIKAAKQVFLEKGYAETRMSDIAEKVGINRSGLHYYFRTKERMFNTVFTDIAYSFIPEIQDIISQNIPIEERIPKIVNVYSEIIQNEPLLPSFAIREIQRNINFLTDTILNSEIKEYTNKIKETILNEMELGTIKKAPIEFIIYTFYGLLFMPYLTKPLTKIIFKSSEIEFSNKINLWKEYVIEQMKHLLCP